MGGEGRALGHEDERAVERVGRTRVMSLHAGWEGGWAEERHQRQRWDGLALERRTGGGATLRMAESQQHSGQEGCGGEKAMSL